MSQPLQSPLLSVNPCLQTHMLEPLWNAIHSEFEILEQAVEMRQFISPDPILRLAGGKGLSGINVQSTIRINLIEFYLLKLLLFPLKEVG